MREWYGTTLYGTEFDEPANVSMADVLDDLDTQESELTKLRKRVKVLTDALKFYAHAGHWDEIYYEAEDGVGWDGDVGRMIQIDDCCRDNKDKNFGYGGTKAREALAESAKIAESKELDDPESFERECGSSGV